MLKILLLEDSDDDVLLIERELEKSGIRFKPLVVRCKSGFEAALDEFNPDVILCDHSLPSFNSIEAFKSFKARQDAGADMIPFILVTGNVSEEFAIQSIKAGVDDYILKDRLKRLPFAIESALEKCRIQNELLQFMREVMAKQTLMNEAEHLAHFGSWQADLLTGKHTWSDATYSLYGCRQEETQPSYELFLSFVHPDERDQLGRRLEDLLKNHNEGESAFRIVDRRGNIKYISCRMKIERDATGRPVRLIGFNLDVTKRRKAEVAREKREEQYRSLFAEKADAVFSLDLQGTFTKVNKGWSDLTGFAAEQVLGMNFRQVIHAEDLPRVDNHYLACPGREPQRYEARIVKAAGEAITLRFTHIPIVERDAVTGLFTVVRDGKLA